MGRKVVATLYEYVRTEKGWRYCKPARSSNRKFKPDYVIVGGREEHHPEGQFYVLVSGNWVLAGGTVQDALRCQQFEQAKLDARRVGLQIAEPADQKGRLISDALLTTSGRSKAESPWGTVVPKP
jgi:hypothetical protein